MRDNMETALSGQRNSLLGWGSMFMGDSEKDDNKWMGTGSDEYKGNRQSSVTKSLHLLLTLRLITLRVVTLNESLNFPFD